MIKLYETPTYRLEAQTLTPNDRLMTLELYQTFPEAEHPRRQRITQLTLPPDTIRHIGLYLIGQTSK